MSYSKEFMHIILEIIDQLKTKHTKDVFTEKSLKILCQSKAVLREDHWLKVRKYILLRLKEERTHG